MPGFERQLARYPQLYSRVGFAHHYRPLDSQGIPQVLAQYWQQLGMTTNADPPTPNPSSPSSGSPVATFGSSNA